MKEHHLAVRHWQTVTLGTSKAADLRLRQTGVYYLLSTLNLWRASPTFTVGHHARFCARKMRLTACSVMAAKLGVETLSTPSARARLARRRVIRARRGPR